VRPDIPGLKELEEWFDSKKEIRGIAKLDPFFERTSKLAARRLKREIERRGTLGGVCAGAGSPHLERISQKESGSDLFRSDGPGTVALSGQVESPQSVVQGRPAQGSAVWPWKEQGGFAPGKRFTIQPALIGPAQPFAPGMPKAQGQCQAGFFDWRLPKEHLGSGDCEAA
jgi:hypothetical protein